MKKPFWEASVPGRKWCGGAEDSLVGAASLDEGCVSSKDCVL